MPSCPWQCLGIEMGQLVVHHHCTLLGELGGCFPPGYGGTGQHGARGLGLCGQALRPCCLCRLHAERPGGEAHDSLRERLHHLRRGGRCQQRPLPLPLREAEDVCGRRHQEPLPGLRRPRRGAGEDASGRVVDRVPRWPGLRVARGLVLDGSACLAGSHSPPVGQLP